MRPVRDECHTCGEEREGRTMGVWGVSGGGGAQPGRVDVIARGREGVGRIWPRDELQKKKGAGDTHTRHAHSVGCGGERVEAGEGGAGERSIASHQHTHTLCRCRLPSACVCGLCVCLCCPRPLLLSRLRMRRRERKGGGSAEGWSTVCARVLHRPRLGR